MIYVWAIEQDEKSKRRIPVDDDADHLGKDVVVPWVLSKQNGPQGKREPGDPQVFNRYYHIFAKGELGGLVHDAAKELGIEVGLVPAFEGRAQGVEIMQDGWERSNYYVELRRWEVLG